MQIWKYGVAMFACALSFVTCGGETGAVDSNDGTGYAESSESEEVLSSSSSIIIMDYSSGHYATISSSSQGAIPMKQDSTGAMVIDFGECSADEQGKIKANDVARADSLPYLICKNLEWKAASNYESDVGLHLEVCTLANQNEVAKVVDSAYLGERYYSCTDGRWLRATETEREKYGLPLPCDEGALMPANVGQSTFMCDGGSWIKLFDYVVDVSSVTPVDYSAGRAMNERLGHGMNLGNAWDSEGSNDYGWGNNIDDSFFAKIKNEGFNSVRIPVRWSYDASDNQVSSSRLSGVKDDIRKAIDQGLAVIVNFHHYTQLNSAGNSSEGAFQKELEKFLNLWDNVSSEMNEFPDDMLVLEILNEPSIADAARVDTLMNRAYRIIRKNAPKKTIMFETYHMAKFADITSLHMPADSNIIFSAHYYEPYTFTHMGHDDNLCKGDATYKNTADTDMARYVKLAQALYPDVKGGHIPMNMGEFGVASGNCGNSASKEKKALWIKNTVAAANKYGISWHYWNYTNAGGFEAFNRDGSYIYSGYKDAFFQN